MPDHTCAAGCGNPTTEALCGSCWATLADSLRAVIAGPADRRGQPTPGLATELDTALTKLVRLGNGPVGSLGRGREQPLPANLRAGEVGRNLRDILGLWVRDLHETHAIRWRQCAACQARWYSGAIHHDIDGCTGTWDEVIDPLTVDPTAVALAAWLLRHPSWLRNHPAAGDAHEEITGAVALGWRTVDRVPDRVPLGVCGGELAGDDGTVVRCVAEVSAVAGQSMARCRECGTSHVVDDRRRVQLVRAQDDLMANRDRLAPTAAVVKILARVDVVVTESVIRNLKARGRLRAKVRGVDGYLRLKVAEDAGPDLWRVGDVLDAISREPKRGKELTEAL